MLIRKARAWEIRERDATPEETVLDRRGFLARLGLGGIAAAGMLAGAADLAGVANALAKGSPPPIPGSPANRKTGTPAGPGAGKAAEPRTPSLYPAKRNTTYVLDRPLSDETVAARYNNFYEFTTEKERVWQLVNRFEPRPWTVEIAGLVEKPMTLDVDELIRKFPLEDRLYRHRCVEAWAMAVPWTGFPLASLVAYAKPLSSARYLRMVSFLKPEVAPGQREQSWYPWPYFEGLSRAEAMNELAFVGTGIYGHELPKQHGAPIRLVTPWKYGFKSIKSIVRFEFVAAQPPTFWNKVAPKEYDFLANVNPRKPHPSWSQAEERMIGTGEKRATLLYNGYGKWVASMYA